MTFVGALRNNGLTAPFVLDGPMDGDAFVVYVREILTPTLATGDLVVMDNLPSHKVEGGQSTGRSDRRYAALSSTVFT